MDKLYVDSDIIIDFFLDRGDFANAASQLFDLGERMRVELFTSTLIISNVYYVLRRGIGHDRSLMVINELMRMIDVLPVAKVQLIKAMSVGFKDYEDAIQYAVASDVKMLDAIITRNIKDYKKSKIAVMTAENYIRYKINKEE